MGHILWYADRVPGEEVRTMQDETYPAQPDADGETLEFALWGDCEFIDDEDLADVGRFAAFVRERKEKDAISE